ncbi:GGDEF domain-containing protein [Actinoplanes xinjiangensis]|uniref:Diguanylate cyclase (GGDEF)-like protein n=1 Tax=Actinoplanes xinjiangensis TaxID=512350 RepID=A0A316ED35_9ACTN|nr:GGDEF domain-containing protein [Actinoplanes xinjiangensis]PWK28391.1 diguanylate cyclase (GGDEF)-like protein [Actinoplanes xinjiangensis]
MGWPRATAPAWPVHAGLLLLAVTTVGGYALADPELRNVIFALVTAVPIVTYLLALGAGHLTDRGPWLAAVAGLGFLTLGTVMWPDWIPGHHFGRAEGSVTDLVMASAHLLFLVGTATALRRHGRTDPGGLIDAALFGLCAAGPLWEWLIGPHLGSHATALGKALLFSDVLVLAAVLGCLIRIGITAHGARGPLGYLVLTASLTLANDVVAVLTIDGSAVWTAQIMMLAYLTLAVGPILPTARGVTEPAPGPAVTRHPPLGLLGAALCANPLIAVVQAVRADGPASVVLPVATMLVVPMVVLRLRLLSSQRARAERTLAHQAHHDELTGLYNRRHIVTKIDEAMDALDRGEISEVTLLLCDLDGFKPVNDRYGHQAGDAVLQAVARRLSAVAGPHDAVGRLGGDEFMILQCGGEPVADRITAALCEPIPITGGTVRIGASVGTATAWPGDGADRESLIARADAAMYAVKARPAAPEPEPATI